MKNLCANSHHVNTSSLILASISLELHIHFTVTSVHIDRPQYLIRLELAFTSHQRYFLHKMSRLETLTPGGVTWVPEGTGSLGGTGTGVTTGGGGTRSMGEPGSWGVGPCEDGGPWPGHGSLGVT